MKKREEYLLVDGYNIIFAWEDLERVSAEDSLESARIQLLEILCNYQGFRQNHVIVVFDAHKVKGNPGSVEAYKNITVVYTREAQTADNYIEWAAGGLTRKYIVQVATSDRLEQVIIMGKGAYRISASDLLHEVQSVRKEIQEAFLDQKPIKKNMLLHQLDPQTAALLERMRFAEDPFNTVKSSSTEESNS